MYKGTSEGRADYRHADVRDVEKGNQLWLLLSSPPNDPIEIDRLYSPRFDHCRESTSHGTAVFVPVARYNMQISSVLANNISAEQFSGHGSRFYLLLRFYLPGSFFLKSRDSGVSHV